MNPFLIYMVKAALTLAALYIVYLLFLGRDTMYERNRYFILFSVFASFIFPLIVIETRQPIDIQFFVKDLTGIMTDRNPDMLINPSEIISPDRLSAIILNIYLAGLVIFGIKTMAEFMSLLYLILRQKNREDHIILLRNSPTSGFSAFGYIFIDARLQSDIASEIIRHEQKHLDNLHFIDVLIIEILKAIQWFNPFIYLVDKSLREVHEFQADEECLNSGITVKRYQGLLLNQVFRTNVFSASDGFSNPTIIRKRIIMMTRRRSRTMTNLKMLMSLPVITFLLISFSTYYSGENTLAVTPGTETFTDAYPVLPPPPADSEAGNSSVSEADKNQTPSVVKRDPYVLVDNMPSFPGGDSELLKYIAEHTRYPESAIANNIMGRVVVRFCVSETGKINRISVLKGVDRALDAEAVRVVSSLPAFEPGSHKGVVVPVWYMVPVNFSLTKGESSPPPSPVPTPVVASAEKHQDPDFLEEDHIEDNSSNTPAFVAEKMPVFPGGDRELLKYVAKNTRYPSSEKENGIMGRVTVKFCVTATGKVDKVSVLNGVHPSLDAEAVRVISGLPDFEPGKQGGKEVPVWYMVPVTFTIR